MPRQGGIQSGTGVYHVMMRGINHQRIFEDSETTIPFSSAYAVRRSSSLPLVTVCQTPATTMHMPLCPTTSIYFFMPRMTRLGTLSSALPPHTCITSTGNTAVTDTSSRSDSVLSRVKKRKIHLGE